MIRFQQQPGPRAEKPSHRFEIGQIVLMKSRRDLQTKAAERFHIKGTLPVKDGSPQYRIRSDEENHDRVTTEDNLEEAGAELILR